MGAQSIVETTTGHNRSVKRSRVLLAAKVRTAGAEIVARLRDLSQKGALVELDATLLPGSEVMFERGTTVVPARVAWSAGRRAGLEFVRMIDEGEVLIHINPPVPQKEEKFRRPRILGEDMTREERHIALLWAKSVGIAAS